MNARSNVKRLDFDAVYSPESRLAAKSGYERAWPIAESAKYYQDQLYQIELLSDQEARRLAYQIQLGQDVEGAIEYARWAELPEDEDFKRQVAIFETGQEAKQKLVTGYLRMVAHVARLTMGWTPYGSNGYKERFGLREDETEADEDPLPVEIESVFRGNIVGDLSILKTAPLPIEDRIQIGTLGLIKAAEKYKPNSPARFSTYAWWKIEGEIIRGIAEDKIIHIPVDKVEMLNKVRKTSDNLIQELGRRPLPNELYESLGHIAGVEFVEEAQNADSIAPLGELDKRLYDRNDPSQEEIVNQIMLEGAIDHAMESALPERERDIIAMRYGFVGGEPMTLEAIGNVLGLTRERVRQLEDQALRRLVDVRSLWP